MNGVNKTLDAEYCKTYGYRLRLLRENAFPFRTMTQIELGEIMGISGRTIGSYESNERQPPMDIIRKYCEYFDVTADYIFQLTDVKESYKFHGERRHSD